MSMRNYGVNDYGLYLSPETMKILASKVCEDFNEKEYDEDMYAFHDELQDTIGIIYISGFDGESVPLNNDGNDDWRNVTYFSNDTIYFLPIQKYPALFKAAYMCMNDIILEVRQQVGVYLPVDFDYRDNIRHFIGSYFG